jgi:hypothetical protein
MDWYRSPAVFMATRSPDDAADIGVADPAYRGGAPFRRIMWTWLDRVPERDGAAATFSLS